MLVNKMKKPYTLKLKGVVVARERIESNKVLTSYVCKGCGKTKKITTSMWNINNNSSLLCASCGMKARGKFVNNTTGYIGVMRYNKTGWQASLMTDGKRKRIFKVSDSEIDDDTAKLLCALLRDQYIVTHMLPHTKSFKTDDEATQLLETLNHKAKRVLMLGSADIINGSKK